jgi:preprotein translocase subunit SecY
MFRTIGNFMRVKDIRKKLFFTFAMLVVYRLGTFIPVPGVDANVLKISDQSAFGVLNFFGGGALKNFSILAMGIMPYITASIIVQLLQMDVVPKFTEWSKEGEVGRKKLAQVTRYGTIVLGFVEAFGMAYGFNNLASGALIPNPTVLTYLLIALTLTAGTSFLMWLGEQITAYGVGNGISVIIFAGIVSTFPTTINQVYETMIKNAGDKLFINILILVGVLLLVIAVIVGVIFIQQANRKIPVQYAKRVTGGDASIGMGSHNTHLPLKVNSAGVIPVIFAVSFIITPQTVASFFQGNAVADWVKMNFDYSKPLGMTLYLTLIFAFAYFYAFVQVNPQQISENLKKQGGYVPGIRPGKTTKEYFSKVLGRLTFIGAIFLSVIAVLPILLTTFASMPASARIGGTSLLIVVGVALDTLKSLEGQLVKRHYKGFIK